MTAGKPGALEGAAGSSYIAIPLALHLTLRSGSPYDMNCKAVLRRVNDVTGANSRQLEWTIEQIEC